MKKLVLTIAAALFSFSVFAANTIDAVMLQNSGGLYVEKDGKMEWSKSVEAGAELSIYTESDENGKTVPVTMKSTRVVNKKDVECTVYKASYNGKDYWVLTDRISMNEKVAVIKTPAAVYRSPDLADFKNSSLPLGEVITMGSKYIANDTFEMYKISYFDEINYVTRNGYVLISKVSSEKNDFTACKLIKQLLATEDETIQEELYKNITKLNLSAEIATYAEEVKESLKKVSVADGGVEEIGMYAYVVNPDTNSKINVRSEPGTSGSVVTAFEDEITQVYVNYKTVNADTIGDSTNYWYNVSDEENISGWVFGDYIIFGEYDDFSEL